MAKNENELKGFTFKKLGTTHINDDGIEVLKQSMGISQVNTIKRDDISIEEVIKIISENIKEDVKENMEELKEDLKKDMKEDKENLQENIKQDYNKLENELAEVKKQNESIQNQNNILIEMLQDQQNKQEEKKGFFDIFKRK